MFAIENNLLKLFKSLDQNNDSFLTKEELVLAFTSVNLPVPSEKDLKEIFNIVDKDIDNKISFEDFRFWFFNLHPLNSLDNLIYLKAKALIPFRHLRKFFCSIQGPQPETIYEKNLNSLLFSLNFGETPSTYQSKLSFSLSFNESEKNKYLKDCTNGLLIRFRIEKSVPANQIPLIFEEFQKCFKGLFLVAQNLKKGFKDIIKELNISYHLHENNQPSILFQFSDNMQKYLFDFQETITNFFKHHQDAEQFFLSVLAKNSMELIMEKLLESPVSGLIALLSDSSVQCSGFIKKLALDLIEITKEKVNSQKIEVLLSFIMLLKNVKAVMNFENFKAEEVENSGILELLPEVSFFLQEIPKFELPKLPIIKKFYHLFGSGFEGRSRIDLQVENLGVKFGGRTKGVKWVFDRFFKLQ